MKPQKRRRTSGKRKGHPETPDRCGAQGVVPVKLKRSKSQWARIIARARLLRKNEYLPKPFWANDFSRAVSSK